MAGDVLEVDEADPRRTIIEIERRINPGITTYSIQNEFLAFIGYFRTLKHAYETFGISFPVSEPKEFNSSSVNSTVAIIRSEIEKLKIDLVFEQSQKAAIVLDETWRDKIHAYLEHIRKIIESAEMDEALRDRIISKLHALSKEVDRNRASIQKFADALVGICEGVSQGAEALTPAVRLLEKIVGALSRVKTAEKPPLALPKPEHFGLDKSDDNPKNVSPKTKPLNPPQAT